MTTDSLDNLMKIHPPGTKFTNGGCGGSIYFECWFKSGNMWYGKTNERNSSASFYSGTFDMWSPYLEPPRKVKKWLWAIGGRKPSDIFLSDKEAQETYGHLNKDAYQKVIGTEIEVEDTP